jgi:hypothetical protein
MKSKILAFLILGAVQSSAKDISINFEESELGASAGKIMVNCDINHSGYTQSCELDTGLDETTFGDSNVTAGLPIVGSDPLAGAGKQVVNCDQVQTDSVYVGDSDDRSNMKIRICHSWDGTNSIGLDFFKGQTMALDISSGLLQTQVELPTNLKTYPLNLLGINLIAIPVQINLAQQEGLAVQAIWDTGSEITAVDPALINQRSSNFEFVKDQDGAYDVNGNPIKTSIYVMTGLSFAGYEVPPIYVVATPVPDFVKKASGSQNVMILGNNLIRQMKWWIDLKAQKYTVQPQ